jgi:hypothetical protein
VRGQDPKDAVRSVAVGGQRWLTLDDTRWLTLLPAEGEALQAGQEEDAARQAEILAVQAEIRQAEAQEQVRRV